MADRLTTRITELLGIRYPILLGGMAHVGNARLAAAVSEAGGLGVLGSATMEPEQLAAAIDEVRSLTDRPFGANISLVVKSSDEEIAVAIERRVPAVVVSGGSARRHTQRLKDGGVRVLHVTPTAALAEKAQAAGVDAVVIEGAEAGGHLGHDELPLSALIPLTRQIVDVPVVAAGGVVCGRGLASALALGADGVQIGTLFIACEESPAHQRYKELLIEAGEQDPVVYGRLENPARGLRTTAVQRLLELDRSGASPEEIDRVRGLGRVHLAAIGGDEHEGIFPAGVGAARIDAVRPAAEIVRQMIDEYLGVVKELPRD